MRESKVDAYICVISLCAFLYSFFLVSYTPILNEMGKITDVEWQTAVYITPPIFIAFLVFMVFKNELKPVTRKWIRKKIRNELRRIHKEIQKGIQEYHTWKK